MTVATNNGVLPVPKEAPEQSGVIIQEIFNLLDKSGCGMEAAFGIIMRVRELEEAHAKLLGDIAGVRGGRDLLAELLKVAQKENEQLQTALLLSRSATRPLMNRISQKVAMQ